MSQTAVVKKSDLVHLRSRSIVKDKFTLKKEQDEANDQRLNRMAVSLARKNRMQGMDRERAANAPIEVKASIFGENTLLSKVYDQMDENFDDVKHMNQMVHASKIYTIRDIQINENKKLEQNWIEEQKRLDMMMEIERLKAIRSEHERQEAAHQAKKRGAQVLVDQIAERMTVRLQEEEMREMEKAQLKTNIEKLQAEQAVIQLEKIERSKIMN